MANDRIAAVEGSIAEDEAANMHQGFAHCPRISSLVAATCFGLLAVAAPGACGGALATSSNDGGVDVAATAPAPYDATGTPVGVDVGIMTSLPSSGSSGGSLALPSSSSSSGSSGGSLTLPSSSSSSGGGAPCTKCTSDSDCTSTCGPPPQNGYYWCCVQSVGQCASQSYACRTSGSSSGGPAGSCPSSCIWDSDCAGCGAPAGSSAKNCCVMGICAQQNTCRLPLDSACADAGGRCVYSTNVKCSPVGPPDACATAGMPASTAGVVCCR